MTIRGTAWSVLVAIGAIASAGISLHGIYQGYAVDFWQNSVLTGAYCLFPLLCFPVFLLMRPARRAALLLALLACAFWAVYSVLNWRTCAELGYCGSVASTVLLTLKTRMVLAFFAVAAISFIADAIDDRRSLPRLKAES